MRNFTISNRSQRILVTGATGTQGRAVALALLAAGYPVRALTRDPQAQRARDLAAAGAEIAQGDWSDYKSLLAAMQEVYGVFSVQLPDIGDTDNERRHANALISAAWEAGVQHIVHTSVAQAGNHTSFPRWESGYWSRKYWTDKWAVEGMVREAGFRFWTVLKPAFMMDNFAIPKSDFMFPHLCKGKILTTFHPDTRLQLIGAEDIGAFACAAFEDTGRFHGRNIELAAEALTMSEIAETLAQVLGKNVVAQSVSAEEAVASGLFAQWVRAQEWSNEVSYGVDIDALRAYGIPLTSFEIWVKKNAENIVIDV